MKRITFVYLFFQIFTICLSGPYHPAIQYIFPLPNSSLLPTKATIILRLQPEFENQIQDIEPLIHVNGNSGKYSGKTFYSTNERTIIFKPNQEFKNGETAPGLVFYTSNFTTDGFGNYLIMCKNDGNSKKSFCF